MFAGFQPMLAGFQPWPAGSGLDRASFPGSADPSAGVDPSCGHSCPPGRSVGRPAATGHEPALQGRCANLPPRSCRTGGSRRARRAQNESPGPRRSLRHRSDPAPPLSTSCGWRHPGVPLCPVRGATRHCPRDLVGCRSDCCSSGIGSPGTRLNARRPRPGPPPRGIAVQRVGPASKSSFAVPGWCWPGCSSPNFLVQSRPRAWSGPWPLINSSRKAEKPTMASRPFHTSELLFQPQAHLSWG